MGELPSEHACRKAKALALKPLTLDGVSFGMVVICTFILQLSAFLGAEPANG